jgi:phage-related protein
MPHMALYTMTQNPTPKPVVWVGASLRDLKSFPRAVQRDLGAALRDAQGGAKPPEAKPLKGFKGAGVLELVQDHESDTYRAVYTVRLADRIYVLHAFQKKSKKGIKTPKHVIDLVKARLKQAEMLHAKLDKEK